MNRRMSVCAAQAAILLLVLSSTGRGSPLEPWRFAGPDDGLHPRSMVAAADVARSSRPDDRAPLSSLAPSWPQGTGSTVVPPVFYDLDHNGSQEVIGADGGRVYVFDHDGFPWPGWPVALGLGGPLMQAAVGDLDGDGSPEILIGWTYPAAQLFALDTAGNVKDGWPVNLPFTNFTNVTCPVLVDLDGDGHVDVGAASENGVSFFDSDGAPLPGWPYIWPVPVNNPQWSAPAVGDIDGDGSLEVVVGNADYPNWGVYAIRANGTVMPGWPRIIEPVFSSPALADLDGDGRLEIVAQEGDPGARGRRLWVWRYDGTVFPGWPKFIAADGMSSRSSPAVADIDHDGALEIITVTGDGNLHVLRSNGAYYPGYPRATSAVQPISSPAVIDVDGDGIEEVFLTYWLSNSQYVSGWRLDGTVLPGFPQTLFSGTDLNSHSSVHVADAEGDRHLDLTASGASNNSGRVWVMAINPSIYGTDTSADWPKMRRDGANLGCIARNPADVALDPLLSATGLRISPNPIRGGGRMTLRRSGDRELGGPGWISITDATGRTAAWYHSASGSVLSLPMESLFGERPAAGVYFLRFRAEGSGRVQSGHVVVSPR